MRVALGIAFAMVAVAPFFWAVAGECVVEEEYASEERLHR